MLIGEIPAIPVVAPLAGVAFGALSWRLHRRGELSLLRVAAAAVVCVYGAGVVANTIFPIFLDKPGGAPPWLLSVNTVPFVGYELRDAIQNVVVFIPLGVLLPVITGTRSLRRVVGIGMLFSLFIETVQFFSAHYLAGGHVTDINDFLFNALGAPVGYGLYALGMRTPIVAGLLHRMGWPRTPAVTTDPDRDGAAA